MLRYFAALIPLAILAACTTPNGPGDGPNAGRGAARGERISLPDKANPGAVVARDLAFARMAREQGQWAAFREFAGPGALLHNAGGPIAAATFLAGKQDPAESVQWAPRAIWSSCDGETAISFGRLAEPGSQFGYYITVWQRQQDGEYKYIYQTGWVDAQLTRKERKRLAEKEESLGDNVILVRASDFIEGHVADCLKGKEPALPLPSPVADGSRFQSSKSADGTLVWRWEQRSDGKYMFRSRFLKDGQWRGALTRIIPSASK